MGLRDSDVPRRRGRLRIQGSLSPNLRAYGALLPRSRRDDRRRRKGNVHLHGQGRPQHHAPSGAHRLDGPLLPRERDEQGRAAREALEHRPDVPLRAPAEGTLPPVRAARHRGARRSGRLRRPRGHRLLDGALPQARTFQPSGNTQLGRLPQVPPRLPQGAPGLSALALRRALRHLQEPLRQKPAAHPRLQEPDMQGNHRGRARGHGIPLRRMQGSLRAAPPRPRQDRRVGRPRQASRARPRLLHEDRL